MSYTVHFSRFLEARPGRLHLAAHSHHPWPDVTFEAQQRAWLEAAELMDDKWERVFGEVIPEAQGHVARLIGLPQPETVAFAPNTHELVMRVLSCLPRPTRILTTDAEFHSFARQAARLEEAGLAVVERLAAEPFASFPDRLSAAVAAGDHHLIYLSQVLFDSGYVVANLTEVMNSIPDPDTLAVVDGYHGFMALPTDVGAMAERAFYTAGGYKYAMAGENACYLHCPPGYAPRPIDTGWYAGFSALTERAGGVPYPDDGRRFLGATFDPTGLYRFNAVQRLLLELGLSVEAIHRHVRLLQEEFLDRLPIGPITVGSLLPPPDSADRGHFLTFRLPGAAAAQQRLGEHDVVTDSRGDRLRIGFGIYHDVEEMDRIADRLRSALG